MNNKLLKPNEVDELLRYGAGRALKLAKQGKIPFITLPDGAIRFSRQDIEQLISPANEKGGQCHE